MMASFIKKHPIRTFFLAMPVVLILWIVAIGTLNYAGICISERRILSDEERISQAIEYINKRNRIPIRTKDKGFQYYEQVKYESIGAFLEANPDCCTTGDNAYGGWPPTFWKKVFGLHADVVQVKFKAHYLDENGNKQSEMIDWSYVMKNCEIWED